MWMTVLEVVGVIGGVATLLGFMLAPMFWLGSKIDQLRQDLHQEITILRKEMNDEFKDFHGRLCAIEEGRKK